MLDDTKWILVRSWSFSHSRAMLSLEFIWRLLGALTNRYTRTPGSHLRSTLFEDWHELGGQMGARLAPELSLNLQILTRPPNNACSLFWMIPLCHGFVHFKSSKNGDKLMIFEWKKKDQTLMHLPFVLLMQARAILWLASREVESRAGSSPPLKKTQLWSPSSSGLSMKRSLQRFLQERRKRARAISPYIRH